MERTEALARLYTLLAAPLREPEEESWQPICSGEWAALLAETLAELGVDVAVTATLGARRSWPEARQQYYEAFLLPGRRALPVESLYKPWSTDPSAALPLAREKGWLGGDSAAHLRTVFAAVGIEIPEAYADVPDHLALELELLALLVEVGTPEQVALFQRQHLDWLPDLLAEAQACGAPIFYQELYSLIAACVEGIQ